MEEVIYKHETNGEFTGIYAQIEDGKLTITEQDMGEFEKEYSRDGEVESFVFFDVANTMEGALSLGVGEPDFPTPEHVREAAIASIKKGDTKYTDNRGTVELRAAAADYLTKFDLHYDKQDEILWEPAKELI